MNPDHVDERLSKAGWSEAALVALVEEFLPADEKIDGALLVRLASAARERAEGHGKDAARLCAAVLNHVAPPPQPSEDTEDDAVRNDTVRWVRWRLVVMLRRLPTSKKLLLGLSADDRKAVQNPELPFTVDEIVEQAPDAAAVAERIGGISRQDPLELVEALSVVAQATSEMDPAKQGVAVANVARAALELVETARVSSEALQAIVEEHRQAIGRSLVGALSAMGDDSKERKELLDWLMRSKAGDPRVRHVGASLSELTTRDKEEILARMRKKATKSNSFRRALVELGAGLLPADEYLALCRELNHPAGIVSVLLDRGELDAAAAEAAKAIEEDDQQWEIAKRFHELGRTDLAIDVLRPAAETTVNSELELWLVEQLEARGDEEEALAVYRRRFVKRPALPQFQALRERVKGKAWTRLRSELITELTARRLHRPLLDIAFDEEDTDLLLSIAPELDEDQAEHAEHVLRSWHESFDGPTPKVDAVLARLEKRRAKREPTAPEVVAAAPIPEKVKHKKFGEGQVVGWSGEGDQLKLEIEFADVGKKTLLARFVEAID
ncbi:MAG TPA: hypothetical protein ENK57_03760 [Polyangiaceae bacterium]|nr:hypothetical protein [Polyangiaceae bacterium]